jgi:site-specific DNA-methyltransferase (adenine-specific)
MADPWRNKLYRGDNLRIMREHVADEAVDLVYLDPPFNSKASYNIQSRRTSGLQATPQVPAFDDTWRWLPGSEETYLELIGSVPKTLACLLQALRQFLGAGNIMAYLAMMAPRLLEMHRVLRPSGSIYLHCDPTASHYLKLLLDGVFGAEHFQNEIIWSYRSGGGTTRRYGRKHDVLLFYSRSGAFTFNADAVRQPYDAVIADKRKHLFNPLGKVPGDVWDISRPPNHSREWLGYPTQKPEALLERIIKASSSEGDLVLDPFCGSGTTLTVAERLHRRWIGIDTNDLAIRLTARRLRDAFGFDVSPFEVVGDPEDLPDADLRSKLRS